MIFIYNLEYKGKPYKESLSVRQLSYELNIPKTTLSRYLRQEPNHKNSFFELDGESIYQYFWGETVNVFSNLEDMSKHFKITPRMCENRLKKKELWFHKYFRVTEVE